MSNLKVLVAVSEVVRERSRVSRHVLQPSTGPGVRLAPAPALHLQLRHTNPDLPLYRS